MDNAQTHSTLGWKSALFRIKGEAKHQIPHFLVIRTPDNMSNTNLLGKGSGLIIYLYIRAHIHRKLTVNTGHRQKCQTTKPFLRINWVDFFKDLCREKVKYIPLLNIKYFSLSVRMEGNESPSSILQKDLNKFGVWKV